MDATVKDAFFLDLDGTLIDTTPTPEEARADPRVRETLQRLSDATGGATMIVSGRTLASIDEILGLRIRAAGQHGAEIRLLNPALDDIRVGLDGYDGLVERCRRICLAIPGARLETKDPTLALHLRRDDPGFGDLLSAAQAATADFAGRISCFVAHNVVELRPAAIHKGLVLVGARLFPPFTGRRPIFIGNDLPDIDGFKAAQENGGYGVSVGPTRRFARYRFDSPADILGALAAVAGAA